MAGHAFELVIRKGQDSPGNSLDEIYWCPWCGTVKHDYHHNGGQKSPNYPRYFIPVGNGPLPNSQECLPRTPPTPPAEGGETT